MNLSDYKKIESHMLSCMQDMAHDKEHVYRVLNVALEIAEKEGGADKDILIAACLLHDIGRKEQNENPAICHAQIGAKKAYDFLLENGFSSGFAKRVSECIATHRFRGDNPPVSTEAKILFDADKIDVTGTLGIARTLLYNSSHGEPLYSLDENGAVLNGSENEPASFFQEYKYKLENVYSKLITDAGREIAEKRRKSAADFYKNMLFEVTSSYEKGNRLLHLYLI